MGWLLKIKRTPSFGYRHLRVFGLEALWEILDKTLLNESERLKDLKSVDEFQTSDASEADHLEK